MTAIEIYEKETGRKSPNNQREYHEWHIYYVEWLEKKVVNYYSSSPKIIFEDTIANGL